MKTWGKEMPKKGRKDSDKGRPTSSTTASVGSGHNIPRKDSDSTTYHKCSTKKPAHQGWTASASKNKRTKLQRQASSDLERQTSEQKIGDTEFFFFAIFFFFASKGKVWGCTCTSHQYKDFLCFSDKQDKQNKEGETRRRNHFVVINIIVPFYVVKNLVRPCLYNCHFTLYLFLSLQNIKTHDLSPNLSSLSLYIF